ncbi:type II toxin-antitoxin system HicB family antitoxin [Candidatus Uhrbacteria bacterium]|nr:type II toxin-antitoxin system HicB family antitoxin [Candidatus Uhrbacteria bacterium]
MLSKHIVNDYPVIVHKDDSVGYWVECPVFEGCYSQGKTMDKALENIQEAIQLCLEDTPKRAHQKSKHNISLHFIRA